MENGVLCSLVCWEKAIVAAAADIPAWPSSVLSLLTAYHDCHLAVRECASGSASVAPGQHSQQINERDSES